MIHGLYNFLPHPAHFMILGVVIVYSIALHSQFKKMQIIKKNENEQKKIWNYYSKKFGLVSYIFLVLIIIIVSVSNVPNNTIDSLSWAMVK